METPEITNRPIIPDHVEPGPVVLTPVPPIGMQIGYMFMPTINEKGELERPTRCLRITVITNLGPFHIPLTEELAEVLARGLARGLGMTEPTRLEVVRPSGSLSERVRGSR